MALLTAIEPRKEGCSGIAAPGSWAQCHGSKNESHATRAAARYSKLPLEWHFGHDIGRTRLFPDDSIPTVCSSVGSPRLSRAGVLVCITAFVSRRVASSTEPGNSPGCFSPLREPPSRGTLGKAEWIRARPGRGKQPKEQHEISDSAVESAVSCSWRRLPVRRPAAPQRTTAPGTGAGAFGNLRWKSGGGRRRRCGRGGTDPPRAGKLATGGAPLAGNSAIGGSTPGGGRFPDWRFKRR